MILYYYLENPANFVIYIQVKDFHGKKDLNFPLFFLYTHHKNSITGFTFIMGNNVKRCWCIRRLWSWPMFKESWLVEFFLWAAIFWKVSIVVAKQPRTIRLKALEALSSVTILLYPCSCCCCCHICSINVDLLASFHNTLT